MNGPLAGLGFFLVRNVLTAAELDDHANQMSREDEHQHIEGDDGHFGEISRPIRHIG